MEALLNTFWLVVALASVCLWALPRRTAVRARSYSLNSVLALCCYLVLVFPLVSISDDLQYHGVAIEDSDCNSPQGKVVKPAECKTNVHHHHHAPTVASCVSWPNPDWRLAGFVTLDVFPPPTLDVAAFATLQRAPPFSSLS